MSACCLSPHSSDAKSGSIRTGEGILACKKLLWLLPLKDGMNLGCGISSSTLDELSLSSSEGSQ
jgi:hypothetical protein